MTINTPDERIKEEITGIASNLIKFNTAHSSWAEFERPDQVKACLEYVREYFSDYNFTIRRFGESEENYGGDVFQERNPSVYDHPKPSLIISLEDTKTPEYLLHGHLDVVPPDNLNYRTRQEGKQECDAHFKPLIQNQRLYGRGACDMKIGVASLMKLMKDLETEQDPPSVALMLVTDEEQGGFRGAGHLFTDVGYSPDFTISAEPSILEHGFEIVYKQKGNFQLDVTAYGTPAHGSKPWVGDCANQRLITFCNQLNERFPNTSEDDRWKTTLNLGMIKGGKSRTSLAEEARAELGIRFTEEYQPVDVMDDIGSQIGVEITGDTVKEQAQVLNRKQSDFMFTIVNDEPMQVNDKNDDYIQGLIQTTEEVTGLEHEPVKKHGASDARFATLVGNPGITFGPRGSHLHGRDEFADLTSVVPYYRIMRKFLTR